MLASTKVRKQVFQLLLTLGIALVVLLLPMRVARADGATIAEKSISSFKGTITVYSGYGYDHSSHSKVFRNYRYPKGAISGVRSSNLAVVNAVLWATSDSSTWPYSRLHLECLKPGKAKVMYTYRGKKKTANIVVKKYACPVKALKIGSKNYAGKLKRHGWVDVRQSKILNKRIRVTPAKGWKLKSIKYGAYTFDSIPNGGKVPSSLPFGPYIVLQNTKTKGLVELMFVDSTMRQ